VAGEEEVKGAYEYLLTQGVLGVLCVLLIVGLVWAMKNLLQAKDDRVSDQKKYAEALYGINEAVKDLTIEMNKSATDTSNEVLRSNEAVRVTVSSLERTQDKLSNNLDNLQKEQVRLTAALQAGRG